MVQCRTTGTLDVTLPTLTIALITAIAGIISLGAGLGGYFITNCFFYERVLLFTGSIFLLSVGVIGDVIGLVILFSVITLQKIRSRKEESAAEKQGEKQDSDALAKEMEKNL